MAGPLFRETCREAIDAMKSAAARAEQQDP